jgi:hypothetical protein
MKNILIGLIALIALESCKNGSGKVISQSDRLKKLWVASSVKHDGVVVYATGGTSNALPGYGSFTLNLTNDTATLIDVDGTTITGKWEVSSDGIKLTLSGLSPVPDGTGGTIEYTVDELTDTQLTITRVTTNAKTGGKKATYVLVVK